MVTASVLVVGVCVAITSADDAVASIILINNAVAIRAMSTTQGVSYPVLQCSNVLCLATLDRSLAPPSCRSSIEVCTIFDNPSCPSGTSVSHPSTLSRDNAEALCTSYRKTWCTSGMSLSLWRPIPDGDTLGSPGRGTAQHPSATRGV